MPLHTLTAQEKEQTDKVVADFIKYLWARKQKVNGRYTGAELTNHIYNKYLKSLTQEEQILMLKNVLLYLSTFKKVELITLLSPRQALSAPALMSDYGNQILPAFLIQLTTMIFKLSTFKDKEQLADFIHENAITSRNLFLANTPDYVEKERPDENTVQAETEIAECNKKAMTDYKNVIKNLMLYSDFLKTKLAADKNGNTKENIQSIERIKNNCENALAMIDTTAAYSSANLPITMTDLIKYTNFAIRFESDIDMRIKKQEGMYPIEAPYIPKAKKPTSHAVRVVAALSKLLDTLIMIKNRFKGYFVKNTVRPDLQDNSGKALMLFFDKVQPGMENDLKEIRNNVAKLQALPKP